MFTFERVLHVGFTLFSLGMTAFMVVNGAALSAALFGFLVAVWSITGVMHWND